MFFNVLLIGLGLSADAFSVSVSNGLCCKRVKAADAVKTGLFFGAAQGIMPVLGFFLGRIFCEGIKNIDHWVAFCFLFLIGIKMIFEAVEKIKNPSKSYSVCLNVKTLFVQAIATSIDAFAVGIGFAALEINIYYASFLIMCITFVLSTAGMFIGRKIGVFLKEKAELCGGAVLIFIGFKILAEHLFT